MQTQQRLAQQSTEAGIAQPLTYAKLLSIYTKSMQHRIDPLLESIAFGSPLKCKYPVFKLLKAINKMVLLNQIQVIFFSLILNQTQWRIQDDLINKYSQCMKDVICCTSDDPKQFRNFNLYLLLVGYTVKFYLNESNDRAVFLNQAEARCDNFKGIFKRWAKRDYVLKVTKRINPQSLNLAYKELFSLQRIKHQNIDIIIDAIIQLSPAYDTQKKKNPQPKVPIQKRNKRTLEQINGVRVGERSTQIQNMELVLQELQDMTIRESKKKRKEQKKQQKGRDDNSDSKRNEPSSGFHIFSILEEEFI